MIDYQSRCKTVQKSKRVKQVFFSGACIQLWGCTAWPRRGQWEKKDWPGRGQWGRKGLGLGEVSGAEKDNNGRGKVEQERKPTTCPQEANARERPPARQETQGDGSSVPGSGRSPGRRKGKDQEKWTYLSIGE